MEPPCTRIIAHETPDQRASWDPHGVDDYCLGLTLDHYICYQYHITKTKGTRIVATVESFPSKTEMPHTSSKDMSAIAALELSNALQNPSLRLLSVTLELPNSRPCTNFQKFSQRRFHHQQHIMHLQCIKPHHSSGAQSLLPLNDLVGKACSRKLTPSIIHCTDRGGARLDCENVQMAWIDTQSRKKDSTLLLMN
jgi:hypothetical protein